MLGSLRTTKSEPAPSSSAVDDATASPLDGASTITLGGSAASQAPAATSGAAAVASASASASASADSAVDVDTGVVAPSSSSSERESRVFGSPNMSGELRLRLDMRTSNVSSSSESSKFCSTLSAARCASSCGVPLPAAGPQCFISAELRSGRTPPTVSTAGADGGDAFTLAARGFMAKRERKSERGSSTCERCRAALAPW